MANVNDDSGQVFLTYRDVKKANPNWTDQMVEDYVALKRDLANTADSGETDNEDIAKLFQLTSGNKARISKNRAVNSDQDERLSGLDLLTANSRQLIARLISGNSKLRARINDLEDLTVYKKQNFSGAGTIDNDANLAVNDTTGTLVMPTNPTKGELTIKSLPGVTITLDPGANTVEGGTTILASISNRYNLDGTVWILIG